MGVGNGSACCTRFLVDGRFGNRFEYSRRMRIRNMSLLDEITVSSL
jgi:hypothetical protein